MSKSKKVEKPAQNAASRKGDVPPEAYDAPGVGVLIQTGLMAQEEFRSKNRIIFLLLIALVVSVFLNVRYVGTEVVVRLLGETTDGRIRPLPLLSDPIYTHTEVLDWASKCVRNIYKMSYIDWEENLRNNTQCLSDGALTEFSKSLQQMGLLNNLTPEVQGIMYAIPGVPTMRSSNLTPGGYTQWVVDVPYRIVLDGRRKGTLDVVMTMELRRVSLTWREDGVWVQQYRISAARGGDR